jgi:hypothetical protein
MSMLTPDRIRAVAKALQRRAQEARAVATQPSPAQQQTAAMKLAQGIMAQRRAKQKGVYFPG